MLHNFDQRKEQQNVLRVSKPKISNTALDKCGPANYIYYFSIYTNLIQVYEVSLKAPLPNDCLFAHAPHET